MLKCSRAGSLMVAKKTKEILSLKEEFLVFSLKRQGKIKAFSDVLVTSVFHNFSLNK